MEFKKQNKRPKGKEREITQETDNYREQTDGYKKGGGWGNGLNRSASMMSTR